MSGPLPGSPPSLGRFLAPSRGPLRERALLGPGITAVATWLKLVLAGEWEGGREVLTWARPVEEAEFLLPVLALGSTSSACPFSGSPACLTLRATPSESVTSAVLGAGAMAPTPTVAASVFPSLLGGRSKEESRDRRVVRNSVRGCVASVGVVG